MNAKQQVPVLRLSGNTECVLQRDFVMAVRFVARLMKRQVLIRGVKSVSQTARGTKVTAPPVSSTNSASAENIMPQRSDFQLRRLNGFALRKDFEHWLKELSKELGMEIASNEFVTVGNPVSGAARVDFKKDPTLI